MTDHSNLVQHQSYPQYPVDDQQYNVSAQSHQQTQTPQKTAEDLERERKKVADENAISRSLLPTGSTTSKGEYSLADFHIMTTLGTGSFGRVHLVRSVHNGRYYAIKVLKKQQVVRMKQVEHTNDERRMLKLVEPFIVIWLIVPVVICLSQRVSHGIALYSETAIALNQAFIW